MAFRIQRSGAYSRAQFDELIKNAPFQDHDIQDMGINLCVRLSK